MLGTRVRAITGPRVTPWLAPARVRPGGGGSGVTRRVLGRDMARTAGKSASVKMVSFHFGAEIICI